MLGCAGCTRADLRSTVSLCPCSASLTEGTAAWRAGMVTATLAATELPLSAPLEDILRALADGAETVQDPHGFLVALRLREFVQSRDTLLSVTCFGRAYLAARDGRRVPVRARVGLLDEEENTAHVTLDVCRPDSAATVLLDRLADVTGLDASELLGLELDVTANVDAARAEDIVLTGLRARPAVPLPDAWRKDTAAPDGEEAASD